MSAHDEQQTTRRPKPPTRQTPTPRYTVKMLDGDGYHRPDFARAMDQWCWCVTDGLVVSRSLTEATARKICRALNASRSKGKP